MAPPKKRSSSSSHRRVELNAFASDQLVEWIEEKLVEHGVEKVVPKEETLTKAVRGFARDLIAKRYLDTFAADIDREVDAAALALTGLAPAVLKMLEEDQALPWDKALAHIVRGPAGAAARAMTAAHRGRARPPREAPGLVVQRPGRRAGDRRRHGMAIHPRAEVDLAATLLWPRQLSRPAAALTSRIGVASHRAGMPGSRRRS